MRHTFFPIAGLRLLRVTTPFRKEAWASFQTAESHGKASNFGGCFIPVARVNSHGAKMASKMDNFQLSLLKQFVDLCKEKPELIHTPQLKFFKDWLGR